MKKNLFLTLTFLLLCSSIVTKAQPGTLIEPVHDDSEIFSIYTDYLEGNKLSGRSIWNAGDGSTFGFSANPFSLGAKNAYNVNWFGFLTNSSDGTRGNYKGAVIFNINSANAISASDLHTKYTHIHFDVWSSTNLSNGYLRLFFRNTNGAFGGGKNYSLPAISSETWTSHDVKLSTLMTPEETLSLTSLLFQRGTVEAGGNIYLDNIYLYYEIPKPPTPPTFNAATIWSGENDLPGVWYGAVSETTSDGNEYLKLPLAPAGVYYAINSPLDIDTRNMLYLNIFAKEVPEAININLSDGSINRTEAITTSSLIPNQWNTITIPLDNFTGISTINSITISGTLNSTIYIDNIVIYETENPYPVASIYQNGTKVGDDEYSVKAAVEKANSLTGDIEIAIIANSIEPNSIYIDGKENVMWNSLTIYPKGDTGDVRTISHQGTSSDLWRSLFMFENSAADVTINGKLNKTGESKSLILQGERIGHSPAAQQTGRVYNNIISTRYAKNITISDCKFKGKSATNRAVGAIQSNGNGIKITNNYFENCLYPGKPAEDDWGNASIINIDGSTEASLSSSNLIEVNGNHFYETEDVNFTDAITYHAFIKIRVRSTNQATPMKVLNNKIGGRGSNLSGGNMRIGYGDGAVQGVIYGIYLQSGYTNSTIPDVDNTSAYNLIMNNEIAHFDIKNNGTGFYESNGAFLLDKIGSFNGISTQDGLMLVKENKIHDINISSMAHTESGSQRYFLTGINSSTYGGRSRIIIDDNELHNLRAGFLNDAEIRSVIIANIITQLGNNSSDIKITGTIRNNKIIFGHSDNHKMSRYADICAISGRLGTITNPSSSSLQLDIYNNTVVYEEFKLTASRLRSSPAINIMNSAQSDAGTINCYNNIAYIQPKTTGSFDGNRQTTISGISHVINHFDGIVNIFHNTVLVAKDNGLNSYSAAFVHDYFLGDGGSGNEKGTLNVWNNNFVNLNDNGLIYHLPDPNTRPKAVYFDYNNYYLPEGGHFLGANIDFPGYTDLSAIKTFDNWKFSNPVSYLNKDTEQDFHGRFLYPRFGNTTNPNDWTNINIDISNINQLHNSLIPKRFIGGKRSNLTNLKVVNIDTNSNPVVSTSNMTDNSNIDLSGNKRRAMLPTMGALNTAHNKYWVGSISSYFNEDDNWNPAGAPTTGTDFDLVFDEAAERACNLPGDITVHDIYNDTGYNLQLGNNILTVTGYIGQETDIETGSRIHTLSNEGTIIFNGTDGHILSDGNYSAAAQHIFPNTFHFNVVNNLYLNNKSQYFVLLHGNKGQEPEENTLNIQNDFAVINANETEITYPNNDEGTHIGGLNCNWYKTSLAFSGYLPTRTPNLSVIETSTADYTYRPFAGQRIPRHGIYNDEVYNLASNSASLVSYHDKLYIRNNLSIANSKIFEIAAEKFVQVFGSSSTCGGLIIKAREESDEDEAALKSYLFTSSPNPRPNASFIYNPAKNNNNIRAKVEMFSPAEFAASNIFSPGGSRYEYRWQYFGSAVFDVSAKVSGSTVYKYYPQGDNNLNLDGSGSPYWTVPGTSDNFEKFDGYCIYRNPKHLYSWEGTLTHDELTRNLTYHQSPITPAQINNNWKDFIDASGDHLLSNPYTAAIDITKIVFGDGLEKTIYIYNTGTTTEWTSVSGSSPYLSSAPGQSMRIPQEYAGKTLTVSPDGTVKFPQFIPSMQGFTIKSSPTSTSANDHVIITYDMVNKNDMPQRTPAYESETTYLLVELKQEGYTDKALIATRPECKKGFDNGWDGKTRPEPTMPLAIFTIEEEEGIEQKDSYYQISTMDDFNDTYLGIIVGNMKPAEEESKTNELVEYELVFKHDNTKDKLFFEDLLLGDTIDITEPGNTYKFYEPKSGEIQKRFRIFTKKGDNVVIETPQSESVNIYSYNKTILFDNKGEAGDVSIYDTMGKCIMTTKVEANTQTVLDTSLQPGIYLVNVIKGNNHISKKIILE